MAKVWVAQAHVDYEGSIFIGVYSSLKKAQAACEAHHDDYWRVYPDRLAAKKVWKGKDGFYLWETASSTDYSAESHKIR